MRCDSLWRESLIWSCSLLGPIGCTSSDFIRSLAGFLAIESLRFSSNLFEKLDFCSHPMAEELSVWLSRQDSCSIVSWKKSTQILITQAKNSSEFKEVCS